MTARSRLTALFLLLAATPARAVPITQFAVGTITRNLSVDAIGPVHPYIFSVGEAVSLKVVADPDRLFDNPDIRIDLSTSGGFARSFVAIFGSARSTDGVLTRVQADISFLAAAVDINFVTGFTFYNRDLGIGSEGFSAMLCQPAAVPEPSTLALGLLGIAFTVLWTTTGLAGAAAVEIRRWREGR